MGGKPRLTQEEFLRRLDSQNRGIYTNDIYVSNRTYMDFYCDKKHHWSARPYNILQNKTGCPFCCGNLPFVGETDLWTTRPDVARLLKNPEDGYKLKEHSNIRSTFICPECGSEIKQIVTNVSYRGLHCHCCADKVSYPNKFGRAVLKQLNVLNIDYEWQPDWLRPYFYDIYFEYNNHKYVVEMDGGVGHGNKEYNSSIIDIKGIAVDKYKDSLAKLHNVEVIRIDCNYKFNDRFEYIKNSILNSRLSTLFSLKHIDWTKCHKSAVSSLVKQAAELYNKKLLIKDISNTLGYSTGTVARWLKQASQLGWCKYNHSQSFPTAVQTNVYTIDNKFVGTYRSANEVSKVIGSTSPTTSRYLREGKHLCNGYLIYLANDESQPDKSKIIYN